MGTVLQTNMIRPFASQAAWCGSCTPCQAAGVAADLTCDLVSGRGRRPPVHPLAPMIDELYTAGGIGITITDTQRGITTGMPR